MIGCAAVRHRMSGPRKASRGPSDGVRISGSRTEAGRDPSGTAAKHSAGVTLVLLQVIYKENRAVDQGGKPQARCHQEIKPHALPPALQWIDPARSALNSVGKLSAEWRY